MKRVSTGAVSDFAKFPISPILEHYGGEPVEDDRRWHDYRCPFHDDSHKSASVRTEGEQIYHCFVCEMKGNATQLLMKREGLAYRDAVRRAEEITGISGGGVRESSGYGASVPGDARDQFSYSAFKRTWVRDEPDS